MHNWRSHKPQYNSLLFGPLCIQLRPRANELICGIDTPLFQLSTQESVNDEWTPAGLQLTQTDCQASHCTDQQLTTLTDRRLFSWPQQPDVDKCIYRQCTVTAFYCFFTFYATVKWIQNLTLMFIISSNSTPIRLLITSTITTIIIDVWPSVYRILSFMFV